MKRNVQVDTTRKTPAVRHAVSAGASDAEIVSAVSDWIDDAVSQLPAEQVSCGMKCSHCCRQSVIVINTTEAKILQEATGKVARRGFKPVKRDRRGQPCPFLSAADDLCTVYAVRPAVCRASISFDDPRKCASEELRQMLLPDSLFDDLRRQLSPGEFRKVVSSQGMEADIREFFD
ncbi:hypothetical protein A9R05_41995 (plasmid) [Burkholderia sp. KK1]|uniref:Flagellin N-methylase n=1 Tax=Burkholderia sp. M701 TaxID=326454 RepID=V5YN81_9BURK|nr:YkgJ family cysteine cluster protein [Burkholderia sp. M701]AQH05597.1 hypothetical protein A9R05_41995 [Burkholderia sp. KK1]BAO18862.1 putative flagellin N-methylase [Burkholderia sp. M701]